MCQSDQNLRLAERVTLGNVSVCSCGTMHVTVGGVTLRMAPDAFGEMVRMCQEATEALVLKAELSPGASRMMH
jgi:hypothetical protein